MQLEGAACYSSPRVPCYKILFLELPRILPKSPAQSKPYQHARTRMDPTTF